jgi:hypothetical protein
MTYPAMYVEHRTTTEANSSIKNTNTKSTENQYVEAWSTTTDANSRYTRHYELKR